MNRTSSSRTRLVSLVFAAAMLAVGCGSSTEDQAAAASDTASDTAASGTGSDGTDSNSTGSDSTDSDPADSENAGADTGQVASGSSTEALVDSGYIDSYTLVDEEFGTMVTVTVDGETRIIETNALPDHETGDFPNDGNPNVISAQDLTWEFSTNPTYVGSASFARTSGVAVNGVKFEPGTAETATCSTGERYSIEALQDIYDLGLDFNNAHVQPTGEYHYHGISQLLVGAYESDDDLVHVGFASDGFLMYYSKSGAYESGYALAGEERTGTDCLISGPDGTTVDLDGTAPDGTYTSDWVWDEANGDLDSCNGTTIDGQYAYFVTDTFPYAPRCLNGEAAAGTGGGGGGAPPSDGAPGGENGAAPAGGGGPDLTEAAATLGVSVDELLAALGGPPPDFEAAAETLGISIEELTAVLPEAG